MARRYTVAGHGHSMNNFGDRLRAARIAAGMTQEQLGFALGVTKASVSGWENNREAPSFKLLPELSAVLGRSLDELIRGSSGPATQDHGPAPELHIGNAEEKALLVRYRAMRPGRRQALLELLKPDR